MLVDDHPMLRRGLSDLLSMEDDLLPVAQAGSGQEAVELALMHDLDLILLDLNMPGMDGFETSSWLQKHHPGINILILTMYDSEIALIRLLQSGVKGFLKKDIHPAELKTALLSVAENGYYYAHNTTGKLASLFQKNPDKQSSIEKAMLSDKEIEFLRLASTDLTYKEIAVKLNITPRAIDGYRDALFDKLDVKSRVGMAIYAVKNGIVTF